MAIGARWLTIVTVVKDDASGLTRTLESIAQQDCDGVELVIIDGSHDPRKIPGLISTSQLPPGLDVQIQHEAPAGIYPAMNSGLRAAGGDFILFLNAGDVFDSPTVLARISTTLSRDHPQWLVGRVRVISADGSVTESASWDFTAEKRRYFARGVFPPHQATFARRSLLTAAGGFDTSYAIAADYALALRLADRAEPVMTELVIAQFVEGGISTRRWQASFREFHRARREILQPSGWRGLRERWDTAVHFARVFAYREVVGRIPRSAS